MDESEVPVCTICGETKSENQIWFLVAENRWEDKLKILHWHEELAMREGIHRACSAGHVQELVLHWMTTGSLDYPFARVPAERGKRARLQPALSSTEEVDTTGAREIGELVVDRDGVKRAFSETPSCLAVILDELFEVLEREASAPEAKLELEEEERLIALPREI